MERYDFLSEISKPSGNIKLEAGEKQEVNPQSVYVVVCGMVAVLLKLDEETDRCVGIYGPDDFFGEQCMAPQIPPRLSCRMRVLRHSHILSWTADEFGELLSNNPKASLGFLQACLARSEALLYRSLLDRRVRSQHLAELLYDLAVKFGKGEGNSRVLLNVSHGLLGGCLNTTRESITTILLTFKQNGWLEQEKRSIHILDMQALFRASQTKASS